MRWIIGIVLGVLALGYVACRLDVSVEYANHRFVPTLWRHTATGWEKVSTLSDLKFQNQSLSEFWNMHPHPALVAVFVALVSLIALVAFTPEANLFKKRPPASIAIHKLGQQELRSRSWLVKNPSPQSPPASHQPNEAEPSP